MLNPIPIPLQTANDAVQLLSIKEISVYGVLILFICYLIWQNQILKKDIKEKDLKIDAVVKEFQEYMRDGSKDAASMISGFQTMIDKLLSAINTNNNHGHR